MTIRDITPEEKKDFDAVVNHPLQTYEWGEFREQTGVKTIRRGVFNKNKLISGLQLTIHKIPKTSFTIGYLPKGEEPTPEILEELYKIGKQENCIFIQLEPNVIIDSHSEHVSESSSKEMLKLVQHDIIKLGLKPAAHSLFTKYTFILGLTKSEEELLKNMHSKARYNIRVAQKHNVIVEEDNSDAAFEDYLRLTKETTQRQGFFAHTEKYHRLQWQTLPHKISKNQLSSHLLVAKYKPKLSTFNSQPSTKILTAWILFVFKDTLYYPYGASSSENREVMSSNLVMWEAIRFGKKLDLQKFDMWGALGENPDKKDPWYGFHSFKEKYGPEHVEFVGSYDLVINPIMYQLYKAADKLRWFLLKLKK
ncbi:peptidoglycan bridge formation glycyltransferase FemA/FemB family protein [Candidatus Roizmanbacteria bacterium]|nr:peptidoglycan bridge formation glycyltransferase FemA/FemB family protein [Candidatus Roizmanbacteria bacterium]